MGKKLSPKLQPLTRRLMRLGSRISAAVGKSIQSLVDQDEKLAAEIIAGDDVIDAEEVRFEQKCIELLSGPSRLSPGQTCSLLCLIKINGDLERIADCTVNIAERVARFVQREAPALPADLLIMANSAYSMVCDSVKAWAAQDADLAAEVMRADDVIDALYDQLASDLTDRLSQPSAYSLHYLDYLLAARNFERIADHATNVAENVVHSATGQIIRHQHASVVGRPDAK